MIREENLKKENTFTLAVNKFSDMNEEDFKFQKMNDITAYTMESAHLLA
jgi:hypothetical protein